MVTSTVISIIAMLIVITFICWRRKAKSRGNFQHYYFHIWIVGQVLVPLFGETWWVKPIFTLFCFCTHSVKFLLVLLLFYPKPRFYTLINQDINEWKFFGFKVIFWLFTQLFTLLTYNLEKMNTPFVLKKKNNSAYYDKFSAII